MLPLIIANWKMQLRDAEAETLARAMAVEPIAKTVEVVLCPSGTALRLVAAAVRATAIMIGAQDCAPMLRGPLTGGMSAEDLHAIGCRYVIIGHSERRRILGETDAMIAAKLDAALAADIHPICCVGETEDERRKGIREAVIRRQLTAMIRGRRLVGSQRLTIAYEPVWAIGSGQAATPADAAAARAVIADTVLELAGSATMERTRIIYGGSVDATNIRAFFADAMMSGALVGTASQQFAPLQRIVMAASMENPHTV